MGLDLSSPGAGFQRFGSYCGVQIFRCWAIWLTARYHELGQDEENDGDDSTVSVEAMLADCLGASVEQINSDNFVIPDTPDYVALESLQNAYIEDMAIHGLLKLVDCSDCDGYWTHGDCVDIVHWFDTMAPHAERFPNGAESFKQWFDKLHEYFKEVVVLESFMIRC